MFSEWEGLKTQEHFHFQIQVSKKDSPSLLISLSCVSGKTLALRQVEDLTEQVSEVSSNAGATSLTIRR